MQNTRYEMQPPAMGGAGRFLEGASRLVDHRGAARSGDPRPVAAACSPVDRLQAFTYTRIGATGDAVQDADGTLVSFPAEAVRSRFMISLESTPRPEFIEGQAGRELYEAAGNNIPDLLIPKARSTTLKYWEPNRTASC